MTGLRATLTFSLDGTLEQVFLIAGSKEEEAILRETLSPILEAYESRGASEHAGEEIKEGVQG